MQVALVPVLVPIPHRSHLAYLAGPEGLELLLGSRDGVAQLVERCDDVLPELVDSWCEEVLEFLEVGAYSEHRHGRVIAGDRGDLLLQSCGPPIHVARAARVAQHQVLEVHRRGHVAEAPVGEHITKNGASSCPAGS